VQIHHIDENPANNSVEILAVLCLLCHNDTMATGGFGKKLKEPEVIKYRDDWVTRVRNRRDEADKIAIQVMALTSISSLEDSDQELTEITLRGPDELVAYVQRVPLILKAGYIAVQPLMGENQEVLDAWKQEWNAAKQF